MILIFAFALFFVLPTFYNWLARKIKSDHTNLRITSLVLIVNLPIIGAFNYYASSHWSNKLPAISELLLTFVVFLVACFGAFYGIRFVQINT